MSKGEKQHIIVGTILFLLSVLVTWYFSKNGITQVVSTGGYPNVAQTPVSSTLPTYPSSSTVTPGADINMGSSPTYLNYNIPAAYDPHLTNGSSDGSGACCDDCGTHSDITYRTMAASHAPNVQDQFNNLVATGLLQ